VTIAQRLHLRCFAEGIEIPVISAVVQSQPNQPAVASIQIPANDYALQLKPRTLIHLFFYDFYRGAPPTERAWVAGENMAIDTRERDPELDGIIPPERLEVTDAQEAADLENENYRLLFAGELVGFGMDKTPTSRSIVLQCMDFSMYWDYAFQYQVNGFELGGGGIRAAFTGAATNVFNSFLEGNADIVTGLMNTAPRSYPNLRGTLLGAVVHLIEAIGGVTYGQRAIRGVNDFFSLAELRLKITQMVGANPFEQQNEVRLLHANGFGSLFRRALSGLGRQVSIRDVLNALQRYIFHEVIPVTSPHFIPALVDPNRPQFETAPITSESSYTEVIRAARLVKQRALDLKQRQADSTTPEDARRLSQRNGGLANELDRLSRTCGRAGGLSRRLAVRERTTFVSNLQIHQKFVVAQERFDRMKDNSTRRAQRMDVRSNTFFPPGTPEAQELTLLCEQIAADMEEVCNAEVRRRVRSNTQQPDPPPRLLQQIYRPDVWMVAPPRCNVFFPELYSNFSYSRQYMEEVSRLMLRTHSAFFGSDFLFDGYYMAPNKVLGVRTGADIGRGRVGVEPPDLADAPAWFVRDMMDHELFTGIIPKFERMSDLNLHALRGGSIMIDGVRVGYAQLAANHIFFQYRFRSRQLVLAGKFNPFCVLGFPALVVDKYKSRDLINSSDVEVDLEIARRIAQQSREGEGTGVGSNLPEEERQRQLELEETRVDELVRELTEQQPNSHYLGTPAAITHSISAETGGTTQVQMAYARVTDERTEFLGDDRYQVRRYRRTRNIETRTVVAMIEPPGEGTVGPRGGEILRIEDVTDEYQRDQRARPVRGRRSTSATGQQRYVSRSRLPLFIPGPRTGRTRGTRVIVGTPVPASSVPEVAALVGSVGGTQSSFVSAQGTGNAGDEATLTEVEVTFRAYRITERLGVYRRESVDLPAEDLTFPPWYGEHYRSQNIGALYGYFFGTGSIVDPTIIVDPTGRSATLTQEEVDGILRSTASTGDTTQPHVTRPETEPEFLDSQRPEVVGAPGEPGDSTRVGEIPGRGSIEEAVTSLVDSYSAIKRNRFDVDDFLRSYTWRRIASMVDMFGTANLEIDDNGEVVRGVEGFHSRAFGDFDDLRQLIRSVDGERRPQTILGLTTMDEEDASDPASQQRAARDAQRAQRMDTRKEKRLAVLRYVHAILATRGILG
jgi:hypothetical protein